MWRLVPAHLASPCCQVSALRCDCRQGCYANGRITILTPYTGQLQLLRKLLRDHVVVSLAEADAEVRP